MKIFVEKIFCIYCSKSKTYKDYLNVRIISLDEEQIKGERSGENEIRVFVPSGLKNREKNE